MRHSSLFVILLVSGCGTGGSRSQEELDRARQATTAVLDAWKGNQPSTVLLALPDPISFQDELRETHALTDYSIVKVDSSDKAVIRLTVRLEMKDKKGKPSTREVVFAVALNSPIVVTRDPFF